MSCVSGRREHIHPIHILALLRRKNLLKVPRPTIVDFGRGRRVRKGEQQGHLGIFILSPRFVFANDSSADAEFIAERRHDLEVTAGEMDAEDGVGDGEGEVAESVEAFEIEEDGCEILKGVGEVDGEGVQETLGIQGWLE